ncbi:hypothetical protein B0H21DRAFT_722856, partial [Amylocystis lapponica]
GRRWDSLIPYLCFLYYTASRTGLTGGWRTSRWAATTQHHGHTPSARCVLAVHMSLSWVVEISSELRGSTVRDVVLKSRKSRNGRTPSSDTVISKSSSSGLDLIASDRSASSDIGLSSLSCLDVCPTADNPDNICLGWY